MHAPRRTFLQAAGGLSLAGLLPRLGDETATAPPADLGSLFPAVEQISRRAWAEYSFIGKRFRGAI